MRNFLDQDFLLMNETAKTLYHEYAKQMPIYDYHCHLSPKEIAEDRRYDTITQLWLGGDHYKWRVMRSYGVDENYITGSASDYEKFEAFAKVIPYTIGNPMYHWVHLELQRYFGIHTLLSEKTSREIYDRCNEVLQQKEFSAKGLIMKSNVELLCTTDDPVDSLEFHDLIKEDVTFTTKVLPAFRPDKAMNIERETFLPWLASLETVSGRKITTMNDLLTSLAERVEYFHSKGCRLSDHALDTVEYSTPFDAEGVYDEERGDKILISVLEAGSGAHLSKEDQAFFKAYVLNFLGKLYAQKHWVMQLHIGALRNNNSRMYRQLGADTGFDSVHDTVFAASLSKLLDDLDTSDSLPKTILYVLNPRDNYVIGTMLGNFQGSVPGKIQFGSGWWFCDQKEGMIDQMKALSSLGLISQFVGMLTDSRSFISYTRHEYFRRILCNLIGEWVENGEYPLDMDVLGEMVRNICIGNARNYFRM